MPEVAVLQKPSKRALWCSTKIVRSWLLSRVQDNFEELTSIDSILYGTGEFVLHDSIVDYGVMGSGTCVELGHGHSVCGPTSGVCTQTQHESEHGQPGSSFNMEYLYSPGAVFVVNQQKYDGHYILTSLAFARKLFDYDSGFCH